MKKSGLSRVVARAALAALLAATALLPARAVHAAAKEILNDHAFTPGAQWLTLRFGYAREMGTFSPDGNVGYGFGYTRMVSRKLSFGANVQHDLLGKFGASALIAVPAMFEVTWHFRWPTTLRPYVGAGIGTTYRKIYRTGGDTSSMEPAYSASVGADVPIDGSHLLGADLRLANVANAGWSVDPVFGIRRPNNLLVSLKLTYSLTY